MMMMISRGDLIGDAANGKERGLPFWFGDKSPDPLQSHQHALVGQFPQRAVDGHAAKAKLRHQLRFGWNAVVWLPDARGDFLADRLFHLFVKRRGRAGWLIR
ncbi:hypothetical protein D3C78_1642490 [compost metagenome]